MPTALQRWVSQRDARFAFGANDGGNPLLSFRQYGVAWKQRGRMSILPEPEKIHVEQRPAPIEVRGAVKFFELVLVNRRRCFRGESLRRDWMDVRRRNRRPR